MIEARSDFDRLAAGLTAKAEALAKARIARRRTKERHLGQNWRNAGLLWPLFTGG